MEVTLPALSEAEKEALFEEQMQRDAEGMDIAQPPAVSRGPWITDFGEQSDRMATCLQEAGFPAVSEGNGISYTSPIPASQEQASDLAWYVCAAQYPLDPALRRDWSSDQLRLVYDYWDQYYIPCMEAHGHPVDRLDQPSRETWVAAFHTADRISWWPNETSWDVPRDQADELAQSCPEYPPAEVMYDQ